jgi:hypothetical protein
LPERIMSAASRRIELVEHLSGAPALNLIDPASIPALESILDDVGDGAFG